MPERYDCIACANELLLRNTIAYRMSNGREADPTFRLPLNFADASRIGRAPPIDKGDNAINAEPE